MSPGGSGVQGFAARQWALGRWIIGGFRFDGMQLMGTRLKTFVTVGVCFGRLSQAFCRNDGNMASVGFPWASGLLAVCV